MRTKGLGAKCLSIVLFSMFLSAALLGSRPARAEIGESEREIADRRTERMLELAHEAGIDLPTALATDQDLYVLITQGAAIADIRILMRTSAPPLPVAQCIEQAATGTTLEEKKVWWTK